MLIGGDGTFRGGKLLAEEAPDIQVVGVPGTIDNDVYGTDYSLGFDTAVATALDAIDKIRDTARSHDRVFLVEVMGRDSGFIALETAIAGGAEELVLPEMDFSLNDLCARLSASFQGGKQSAIVVVAEGGEQGRSLRLAEEIGARLGLEPRVAILGHVQRGGSPTHRDRVLGSLLGVAAVEALLGGEDGTMIGEVNGQPVTTPLVETFERKKGLDDIGRFWLFRLLSG